MNHNEFYAGPHHDLLVLLDFFFFDFPAFASGKLGILKWALQACVVNTHYCSTCMTICKGLTDTWSK